MTTKTDNKTKEYLVFIDAEYYDVDNETWENCSSDTYFAHIDVDVEQMNERLADGWDLEDFFYERCCGRIRDETQDKWIKHMSEMEWSCMTLQQKEIFNSRPRETYTAMELFADTDAVRIVDISVESK